VRERPVQASQPMPIVPENAEHKPNNEENEEEIDDEEYARRL